MNALILPSLLLVCAAADAPPAPQLPLGKETTFVTGPLDKLGYVDYEAALNAEYGRGVTPERNANALLLLAVGPWTDGSPVPPAYYKWLDIAAPPRDGAYFTTIAAFNRDRLRLSAAKTEELFAFYDRAPQRAWVAKDCPPLAEWLAANDKPLALVREAVKRPDYFDPLVSRRKEGESSSLVGTLNVNSGRYRNPGWALAQRATLRLGEKKYDEAWRDLIACHRLGRLITRGPTLIDTLVGRAVCQVAGTATLAYLDRADLTGEQLLDKLKEFRALPAATPSVRSINLMERMGHLDILQAIRRNGGGKQLVRIVDPEFQPGDEQRRRLDEVDWTTAMRTLNARFDRMTAAMRLADRAAREEAFDKIERELSAARADGQKPGALAELLATKDANVRFGRTAADVLVAMSAPAIRKCQGGDDRMDQSERNLCVAFALAAYRADNDRYPETLAELARAYLPEVPADLFGGKPLAYKPSANGYLLYSVGPNGKDDGGRGERDDPPGDDLSVRMPLPLPKKK
jgi:hypothetical protein